MECKAIIVPKNSLFGTEFAFNKFKHPVNNGSQDRKRTIVRLL